MNYIVDLASSGLQVTFRIAIANENFTAALKDSAGQIVDQLDGYGDGARTTYILTAKSPGLHILEITCHWDIDNPCSVGAVQVLAPLSGATTTRQNKWIVVPVIATAMIALYFVLKK